jgi:hypothetical protein
LGFQKDSLIILEFSLALGQSGTKTTVKNLTLEPPIQAASKLTAITLSISLARDLEATTSDISEHPMPWTSKLKATAIPHI